MESLIYNIPASLVTAYRGRQLILRSMDPAELARCLAEADPENVFYLQLLSLDVDVEPLASLKVSVALDIVMHEPEQELPFLYRFSRLLDKGPVRISIPVKPGFARAVKLALALNFPVKLEVGQPEPSLIKELSEVLDLYLHRTTVSQPVEYFHSTFISFYNDTPSSLWLIQEEDPEQIRFVSDDRRETASGRFGKVELENQLERLAKESQSKKSECDDCEFFDRCGGYFKWPDNSFSCDGVKTLFTTIREAAAELRHDLDRVLVAHGGQR